MRALRTLLTREHRLEILRILLTGAAALLFWRKLPPLRGLLGAVSLGLYPLANLSSKIVTGTVAALLLGFLGIVSGAWVHCDTTQGPVVADARIALDRGDITPILEWSKPERRGAY
jgi:hypothetical protein